MKTFMKQFILAISGILLSGTIIAGGMLEEKPLKFKSENFEKGKFLPRIQVYDENSNLFNFGVGFSGGKYNKSYRGAGYSHATSPMFNISYEQALKRKLGPGHVGVGGFFSYQNAYSRYDNIYYAGNIYYYKHNWNYYTLAARGTYHWDALNFEKGEFYAGTLIGARIHNYSYSTNNPDPESNVYRLSEQRVFPAATLFLGARWYFAPNAGLYTEAGAGEGLSFVTGGFSIKF